MANPIDRDRHVRRGGAEYTQALMNLLPTGQAWPRSIGGTLFMTVQGLANYWGTVDGRAADLLEIESDPRLTTELLPDWERNWGLPDPCIQNPPTDLETRRIDLVLKMTLLGAQSRQWFMDVATALGYTITITEYSPYVCGISRCGDTSDLNLDEPGGRMRWELGPAEMRYYWTVHVDALRFSQFYVASSQCGVDRLLAIYGPEDLICIFERWKPAHTQIVWDFSPSESLDYTLASNTMYLPMGIP
jgi:uncharacterized protein YmfQ (DUF2313 family)